MNKSQESVASPFEQIRHETEDGGEYWTARELGHLLGYANYRNFLKAVERARGACAKSGCDPAAHFIDVYSKSRTGKGARRKMADVHLSRLAIYLLIQNSDPSKHPVALGQGYIAVQTRRRELAADPAVLAKRLQEHGDESRYEVYGRNGLGPSQTVLDGIGGLDLGAKTFWATQAEARIQREGIRDQSEADRVYQEVGRAVRAFLAKQVTTLPEEVLQMIESGGQTAGKPSAPAAVEVERGKESKE